MKIQIQNVAFTYPGGTEALKGISLDLPLSGLVGLLGPNGAGKSTFIKLLSASRLPTSGSILVNGRPLIQSERFFRSHLGYLPQGFGLFDELTPAQFLEYMSALKEISGPSISRLLEAVHLEDKADTPIRSLSGGQRQRVGIAQALLGDPSLLILDEPTAGLDPEERAYFRSLFSEKARHSLVLLSTHIIEDLYAVCSRLLVIRGGQILFSGTPERLIQAAASASHEASAASASYAALAPMPVNGSETGAHDLENAYLRLMSGEVVL